MFSISHPDSVIKLRERYQERVSGGNSSSRYDIKGITIFWAVPRLRRMPGAPFVFVPGQYFIKVNCFK